MIRKWCCFLLALVAVLEMGLHTRAAETTGSITVQPVWCGTEVVGGTVSVQHVGKKTAYGYLLTDGLADWQVDAQEMEKTEWIDWLMQHYQHHNEAREVGVAGAVFSGLQEGIYLVRQSEAASAFSPFRPFLLTIPTDGNWDLAAKPKLTRLAEAPKTADRPAPIIGAMGIGLSVSVLMVLIDERKK